MAKDTCEDHPRLSIFRLKEWGYFNTSYTSSRISWENGWGRKESIRVIVDFNEYPLSARLSYNSDGEDYAYNVRLEADTCRFGGKRYWFICPLNIAGRYCGRRCAMLYSAGRYFGCRKCYDLAYSTQQVSYSGMLAGCFELMTLSDKIDKKLSEMRVKYWRGRPTKRYAKLLRKMARLGMLSDQVERETSALRALRRS